LGDNEPNRAIYLFYFIFEKWAGALPNHNRAIYEPPMGKHNNK